MCFLPKAAFLDHQDGHEVLLRSMQAAKSFRLASLIRYEVVSDILEKEKATSGISANVSAYTTVPTERRGYNVRGARPPQRARDVVYAVLDEASALEFKLSEKILFSLLINSIVSPVYKLMHCLSLLIKNK